MPNSSGAGGAGPRMHNYVIRASGAGEQGVQVAPGLLGIRTPVKTNTTIGGVGGVGRAIIGGSLASASASVPLSVSLSESGAWSSCRADSKTTSSGSANEVEGGDVDSNHRGLHHRRTGERYRS